MIYINGKFLAQRTTGVQRFARGVIGALDQSLLSTPCGRAVELLLPPTATPIDGLKVIRQRVVGRPGRSLTVWEQMELPRHTYGGTLICLSGSAPLLVNECVPTIHDAAIYLYPKAYSRAFVTWYRLLFSLRAWRSPLVLTVSETSARELAQYLPNTSYRVVPNSAEHITKQPSDLSVLERLGLETRKFLLSVGSLNPTKNFLALIDAYSASSISDQLPLVIVGAVNCDVFTNSLRSNNHPNVKWAGSLPDTQLRSLYENASVFVFPSLYEGFGIPPIEAMLCACPVVASNSSAIPEVCGDAAQYFDPTSPADMMAAINIVLDNEEYRSSLIDKGLRRAKSFSWNNSAIKLRAALADFSIIDE